MTSIEESRQLLAQYKLDNPQVDWDLNEAYAIVREDTGEVERIGVISKKALENLREQPK